MDSYRWGSEVLLFGAVFLETIKKTIRKRRGCNRQLASIFVNYVQALKASHACYVVLLTQKELNVKAIRFTGSVSAIIYSLRFEVLLSFVRRVCIRMAVVVKLRT